jgi:hypothetical protein
VAPGRGALRLIRVAFFALAAVGLASAAHLAGGESLSGPVALGAVPAVMVAVNLLASGRRGRRSLLIAMGLTQVLLHLALMAGSLAQACQLVGGRAMAGMSMESGPGSEALHCGPGMAQHTSIWPTPTMLVAHALATLVLVLVLAHGEAVVWALAAGWGFRLHHLVPPLRPAARRRLPVPVAAAFRPRSSVARRSVRRRGPPRSALAVP